MDIFIFEDCPERKEWFKKTFAGHNIDMSENVDEATSKLASSEYDIIFLDRDISCPRGTNGEDLAWNMKENKIASSTPIVIHSMNARGQRVIAKYLRAYNKNVHQIKFDSLKGYSQEEVLKKAGVEEVIVKEASKVQRVEEIKESQSILDVLLRSFPDALQQFGVSGASDDSRDALYKVWSNPKNRNKDGSYSKPIEVESSKVAEMERDGLVKASTNSLSITAKGAEVLKTMILGDDSSAFDKDTDVVTYRQALANTKGLKKANQAKKDSWWG